MTGEEFPLGADYGDDDLSHLPPKERARMHRLRDFLAVRVWSPSQANAVLCGYHPEVGPNTNAANMAFLPGADSFYGVPFGTRAHNDLREVAAGLEDQRDYIRGLRLTTMAPKQAIAIAITKGVPIPWLEVAKADPECRKYLPPEALVNSSDAPRVPLTAKEVASRGGIGKRDNDSQRAKWLPLVETRLAEGWKPSEILAEFEVEDDAPPPSTLYGWCKKIKLRKGRY